MAKQQKKTRQNWRVLTDRNAVVGKKVRAEFRHEPYKGVICSVTQTADELKLEVERPYKGSIVKTPVVVSKERARVEILPPDQIKVVLSEHCYLLIG